MKQPACAAQNHQLSEQHSHHATSGHEDKLHPGSLGQRLGCSPCAHALLAYACHATADAANTSMPWSITDLLLHHNISELGRCAAGQTNQIPHQFCECQQLCWPCCCMGPALADTDAMQASKLRQKRPENGAMLLMHARLIGSWA